MLPHETVPSKTPIFRFRQILKRANRLMWKHKGTAPHKTFLLQDEWSNLVLSVFSILFGQSPIWVLPLVTANNTRANRGDLQTKALRDVEVIQTMLGRLPLSRLTGRNYVFRAEMEGMSSAFLQMLSLIHMIRTHNAETVANVVEVGTQRILPARGSRDARMYREI